MVPSLLLAACVAHLPTTAEFEKAATPIWLAPGPLRVHNDSSTTSGTGVRKAPALNPSYAWFRKEVRTGTAGSTSIKRANVLITAPPGDAKILSAYKLWINDIPVSDGQ